jgi:hypothetical protein
MAIGMSNLLANLNNCAAFPAGDDVEIWYMKPSNSGSLLLSMFNDVPFDPAMLTFTHTLLGTTSADPSRSKHETLEYIYENLQAFAWSPCGEANSLIKALGLKHTSMNVGDVVKFKSGDIFVCKPVGWERHYLESATQICG